MNENASGPRVLSVQQPFAALIAAGLKRVENRSWETDYRGPLLIHASKTRGRVNKAWRDAATPDELKAMEENGSFGAVVAVCEVRDCLVHGMDATNAKYPWVRQDKYAEGIWLWFLAKVRRVEPIPLTGMLGLYKAPAHVLDALDAQGVKLPR